MQQPADQTREVVTNHCWTARCSTEAVTGIVGRAELLSALCVLLSLESYRQGRWCLAAALTELAYGCKETGLLGFALFVWMDLVGARCRSSLC